jgi:hypothetical protein
MQLFSSQNLVIFTRMSEKTAYTNLLSFINVAPSNRSNTLSSARSNMNGEQSLTSKNKSNIRYTYINKLARYTRAGIELYDKDLKAIRNIKVCRDLNWVYQIKERADVINTFYKTGSDNFQ